VVWLRLLVGVGILGLILGRIDLSAATVRPTSLLLVAVLAGASLLVLSQAVAAMRWKAVLGDDLLPWGYLWRLYTIGSFFGLFLPTSVGGDAVRALAAARSSDRAGRAMVSVLIDRASGIVASLGYAALGLILAPGSIALLGDAAVGWRGPGFVGTSLVLMGGGLAVLVLRRSRRARTLGQQGIAAAGELARSPRRLARVTILALVSQGLIILLWYLLARGVHFTLPASTFLWAVPLVSLSALLPVTFAGLGVREGVWLVLLSDSGIPPADVVAFSLLYFACTLLVGITGGLLFVTSGMTLASADSAGA
jgi:uncharacterized membrane protein YbhN (UPF0104 family)